MINKEAFMQNLKYAILESGKTQTEIAQLAEITEPMLSDYLRGKRIPRAFIAQKLANVLNISTSWLYNNEFEDDFNVHDYIKVLSPQQISLDTSLTRTIAKMINTNLLNDSKLESKYYELIDIFAKLNLDGLDRIVKNAQDLAQIHKYTTHIIRTPISSSEQTKEQGE